MVSIDGNKYRLTPVMISEWACAWCVPEDNGLSFILPFGENECGCVGTFLGGGSLRACGMMSMGAEALLDNATRARGGDGSPVEQRCHCVIDVCGEWGDYDVQKMGP